MSSTDAAAPTPHALKARTNAKLDEVLIVERDRTTAADIVCLFFDNYDNNGGRLAKMVTSLARTALASAATSTAVEEMAGEESSAANLLAFLSVAANAKRLASLRQTPPHAPARKQSNVMRYPRQRLLLSAVASINFAMSASGRPYIVRRSPLPSSIPGAAL